MSEPPDRIVVMAGGEVLLSGWFVRAVTTAVAVHPAAMKASPFGRGPLSRLLEELRRASALTSAAQATQVALVDEPSSWSSTDEISVKEAAKLMGCTESNVRDRCRRGTLAGAQVGREWRLSRADVVSQSPARRAS